MRVRVGTVLSVRRYPVKSMRAEVAPEFKLGWNGFEGDRQFAFCKTGQVSRFPWLTGRDLAELVLHQAAYAYPDVPHSSPVWVRAPDGTEFDLADPGLARRLGEASGMPVHLMQLGRGVFDSMPVSVLTTAAADGLAQAHGSPVGLDRFRGNVVIETDEDLAPGAGLIFEGETGTARLRADTPIPRCRMITLDPDSAAKSMAVLRTVVDRFSNLFGVYCATELPGRIAVGDQVWTERDA